MLRFLPFHWSPVKHFISISARLLASQSGSVTTKSITIIFAVVFTAVGIPTLTFLTGVVIWYLHRRYQIRQIALRPSTEHPSAIFSPWTLQFLFAAWPRRDRQISNPPRQIPSAAVPENNASAMDHEALPVGNSEHQEGLDSVPIRSSIVCLGVQFRSTK
ncbi:unnamed protein product [Somion occarium]|uniref:Uncharacterized protein n=1 Tax=Somion occarium TaxID=3059160 RepID=A0ABP1E298_9APHY